MTSLLAAILITLSSLGVPGFDGLAVDPVERQTCDLEVSTDSGQTIVGSGGPGSRKISNGF
jgi:hypothetical protein